MASQSAPLQFRVVRSTGSFRRRPIGALTTIGRWSLMSVSMTSALAAGLLTLVMMWSREVGVGSRWVGRSISWVTLSSASAA